VNKTTLDLFEQKAHEEAMKAYQLCEKFAAFHELPVEYVWQEFANPEVDSLEAVTKALDFQT
jgi:hypothetical protein